MIKKEDEFKKSLGWKEEELPLIYAAIADMGFFKRKLLLFVIQLAKKNEDVDNEILFGFLFIWLLFGL